MFLNYWIFFFYEKALIQTVIKETSLFDLVSIVNIARTIPYSSLMTNKQISQNISVRGVIRRKVSLYHKTNFKKQKKKIEIHQNYENYIFCEFC